MKSKVILRDCTTYDPQRIAQIIGEGMDELGVRPHGRTLVKPNVVIAHPLFFAHAYTRPEFLDGLLRALQARGEQITELAVGERSGITVPTRYAFHEAGYPAVLRRRGVKAYHFDEVPQVERRLTHPQALRSYIYVPKPIAECEFLVNAPKFKAHPWTKVTLSLKNYIGIQDDRHRLIDHDHLLEYKIVDLQEVVRPGFIAIDGIVAGQKTMLTPTPFPLGLIVMGVNPVAVDSVCTRIVGLDPADVHHIRMAHERGLGPIDLMDIELSGDVTLDAAIRRAEGFELTLERVDEIFNGRSNITIYAGTPPDPEPFDYCWGGCPGGFFEAVQIIRVMQPEVFHEVKRMHIVFGHYQGKIEAQPGEPVLFIGDCAQYKGPVNGQAVEIPSLYKRRERKDPRHASSVDLMLKMVGVARNLLRHRGRQVIRIPGCPVSVAENALYISMLGKTQNPYLHPSIVFRFSWDYTISQLVRSLPLRR